MKLKLWKYKLNTNSDLVYEPRVGMQQFDQGSLFARTIYHKKLVRKFDLTASRVWA